MNAQKKMILHEEMITKLILRSSPKVDARGIAKKMLIRNGSLAPTLELQIQDLMENDGLSYNTAQLLSLMPQLARYMACEDVRTENVPITTVEVAGRFFKAQFIGVYLEQLYVMCLNGKGDMLAVNMIQEGTVDQTPFYLRHILETAIRDNAEAIVLCHNHPSGTRKASAQDVEVTERCINLLNLVGVVLVDHLIIADGDVVSMHRDDGEMRKKLRAQTELSELLRNWCHPPLA